MQAHIKSAAITTAVVLVGIYILRKLPVTSNIVDNVVFG